MIRVGVDAGGTFTDFVAVGEGWQRALKLPSRADDPAAVVHEALRTLVDDEGQPVELVFSTTAATNALLERRGGPSLLVTTSGFEDVLEIGRQVRPRLYELEPVLTSPLIAAHDRVGIRERIGARGEVVCALEENELDRVVAELRERDPSARATIAICLLHSYAAPAHEQMIADRLRSVGWRVTLSTEVCPLPREYERTSTTVIDAYVAPALGATLGRLEDGAISLRVMESSGGARAARSGAAARPARTVLSGPAAGVIAAEAIARRQAVKLAIAVDMGGTSTDVALIVDGRAARVEELAIDGLPIALPSVAVRSVGAGGGSIAWIDEGGALKVGPRSAGAIPGPAAYGRGGTQATVTDAQLVLGRLGATICGGAVPLDRAQARAAVEALAGPLGVPVEAAALGILAVANVTIARAARLATLGEVPELLIAYGGASGLHAVALARALGIARVLVPIAPGLQCAIGALSADVVVDEIAAWGRRLDSSAHARMEALAEAADSALERDQVPRRRRLIEQSVRARYVGQGIDGELELPFLGFDPTRFHQAHEVAYGHRLDREVEVVSLRARGVGSATPAAFRAVPAIGWDRVGTRGIHDETGPTRAPIYARDRLRIGRRIVGPALVEELSSTLFLPSGASAVCLESGELLVEAGR